MNIPISWLRSTAPALAILLVSSCSLEHIKTTNSVAVVKAGLPLQAGARYEVRKALQAGVPFRPQDMKSYYFVMERPRPPLVAATVTAGKYMNVRTTAYCHDESDHLVYGTRNAIGTNLKFGNVRSAAADWSRYPVGTLFRISGQPNVVYEVDDYGSALVGTGTIDLYKPSRGQMNDWGVRNVEIEVIRWGSFQRSKDIMKDRSRWPHVRRMLENIEANIYQVSNDENKRPGPLAL
jgi:3D (Asp-Asp-Asp) domain-containing protein